MAGIKKSERERDKLLKVLVRDCIWPLYKNSTEGMSKDISTMLGDFFNIDTREIYMARATHEFDIQGLFWLGSPQNTHEKWGKRDVYRYDYLLIRFDSGEPNRIDLEVITRPGGYDEESRMFTLTREQWNGIKEKVEINYTTKLLNKGSILNAEKMRIYHEQFIARYLGCRFKFGPRVKKSSSDRSRDKLQCPKVRRQRSW